MDKREELQVYERAPEPLEPVQERRWVLIRDLVVFQGKLFLDGLRDLLLAPASLVAGIIGLVTGRRRSENLFYDVLRFGHRMERWINLFGAIDKSDANDKANVDRVVAQVEDVLRKQSGKGGITNATKERIDALLDSIQTKNKPEQ